MVNTTPEARISKCLCDFIVGKGILPDLLNYSMR